MSSEWLNKWDHKDVWRIQGKSCLVEVSRHRSHDGRNAWCVYLWIYPKHPVFGRIKPHAGLDTSTSFYCHSYMSYFKTHTNESGAITAHQLGWDYNHDGDWRYGEYATPDDAASVFFDAERLLSDANNWIDKEQANV